MDGRRVRSLSCSTRRRIPSESNPSPPVERENPFRFPHTPENKPKSLTQVKESTINEVHTVKLREKKVNRRDRMTQSLILDKDLNKFSSLLPDPGLKMAEKSGSTLSFTSVPSPYRSKDKEEGRVSLLSKCSYRNLGSSARPARMSSDKSVSLLPAGTVKIPLIINPPRKQNIFILMNIDKSALRYSK